MKTLLVVNSILSQKTAQFWEKNKSILNNYFSDVQHFVPETINFRLPAPVNEFEVVILVGSDRFYSLFINAIFYDLGQGRRQTAIAFIPDRKNSATAIGLGLPDKLEHQLELISKRQSIALDLVRCHYMDKKGIPGSYFILNDALIGVSSTKMPLILRALAEVAKNPPILPIRHEHKQIKLCQGNNVLYEGGYAFAAILLGNKITDGPKIPGRTKIRCHLTNFEYYQLNCRNPYKFKHSLASFSASSEDNEEKLFLSGRFNELVIKGEGPENSIIADGMYLGRLPATFSFLPKAVKVISPLLTVRVCQPWSAKVTNTGIPKPIGSRNSLRDSSN